MSVRSVFSLTATKEQKSPEDVQLDIFSHMVIEDFMMRKGLNKTLQEFRKEWERPDEKETMLSWYEVATKLRLGDIAAQSKHSTILENITTELINESANRLRKPPAVVVEGLAMLPKSSSLPTVIFDPLENQDIMATATCSPKKDTVRKRLHTQPTVSDATLPRKYNAPPASSITMIKRMQDKPGKPSSSNWIPDQVRVQMYRQDMALAQENLGDIILRETKTERDTRQIRQSDLERAKNMESLGMKKRTNCGCCMQKFSFINLPLAVSHKAIIDIRKNWMSKAAAAKAALAVTANGAAEAEGEKKKPEANWWDEDDLHWSLVPRCYDKVHVCLFCSQFFLHDAQESYRPSVDSVAYQNRKAAYHEAKRVEREYWDPLRMCDKDRALEEAAEALAKKQQEQLAKELARQQEEQNSIAAEQSMAGHANSHTTADSTKKSKKSGHSRRSHNGDNVSTLNNSITSGSAASATTATEVEEGSLG